MTEESQGHETSTSMTQAPPNELDAGVYIALKVKVSCPSMCNLKGRKVRIIDQDATVQETFLTEYYGTVNETDRLIVKAPSQPGEYTWTALFPAQEKERVLHQESSAQFSFVVKPHHATSMAVWDVPSAVAVGDRFRMKVGVKCSAECRLTDQQIEIHDHEGGIVATGKLGDAPWRDTGNLYWAEVELEPPDTEGHYRWTVKFPKSDLDPPHDEAAHTFDFRSAGRPEYVVTVEVIDKNTQSPIKNADVLLHPYRGKTDERGMLQLMVPKGEYRLYVSKYGFETFQTTVKAAGDVAAKAELLAAPVIDDDG